MKLLERVSPLAVLRRSAERGHLPDILVRHGIRRLLKARLNELRQIDRSSWVVDFIEQASQSPIAVATCEANEQHYEVPAQFFQAVLGHRLKYSSCYWPKGVETLDAAEDAALKETCTHAGIEDGMAILELGCGWGSLSLWMAENYPGCQITSVSNSNSQREFIESRAQDQGLQNLNIITADVTSFEPDRRFDRIVSVEMFEHMRNHRELMNRIAGWLSPCGRLFVHIFCHRSTPYLFETDGEQNWMGRYFFTGGMMPSEDLLPRCGSSLRLTKLWRWNGIHYARTCRAWLNRQDSAADGLLPTFAATYGSGVAECWHNRWRLFFMACEELFAFRGGEEWFVSHYLFEK